MGGDTAVEMKDDPVFGVIGGGSDRAHRAISPSLEISARGGTGRRQFYHHQRYQLCGGGIGYPDLRHSLGLLPERGEPDYRVLRRQAADLGGQGLRW